MSRSDKALPFRVRATTLARGAEFECAVASDAPRNTPARSACDSAAVTGGREPDATGDPCRRASISAAHNGFGI
ncbi:hypothetical protein GCM10010495_53400 [Kitasatospora herbaricolor]|uniref:Uncharacterized protein n=1 Tax=Kitasatospora indigofera TaxID=67307 RepID=A0A919FU39_9ACTN|nr:hypothetical protein GCM10010495_53400 [Kitasatospora herbaricolor]GHH71809.1 hypothetical protein GCM10018781_33770 [Kitasatospora indigofera]